MIFFVGFIAGAIVGEAALVFWLGCKGVCNLYQTKDGRKFYNEDDARKHAQEIENEV